MKIIFFCFVSLVAFGGSAQQLLSNPDFESFTSGLANGWTKTTDGTGVMTCTQDTVNPHGGSSSQKAVVSGINSSSADALLSQTFSLKLGLVYNGSIWLRASVPNVQVAFYLRLNTGVQEHALYTATIGTNWQQVVINGGWQNSGTGYFIASFLDNATYWVDDASLTDATANFLSAPLENPGATTPSTMVGLNINKLQATNWPPINQGLVRLWDTGTQWQQVEGSSNSFSFAHMDAWVNHVLTNNPNCKIMYTMGQTPDWANPAGQLFAPLNMRDWSNYVYTVANRYKGQIKYYEVWNEWDSPSFYKGSVPDMVSMATLAKAIITNIDSGNMLVAPVVTLGGFQVLQNFIQQGGKDLPDIFAYHNYPTSIPEQCLGNVIGLKDMLANNSLNKPLWCTEGSPDQASVPEPAATSRGIASRVYLFFWAQNVQSYDWYTWDLSQVNGTNKVPLGGPGHVASPGGAAVSMLATNWLGGAKAISKTVDSNGTWQFQVQQPNKPYNYIVWNPYSNAVFNIPASWSIYQQRDLLNNATSLAGITTITSSITPVILDSAGVVTCSAIAVRPALLAPATVGSVYNQFHSAIGGMAPYTFFSGDLPPGFTLSSGGALSGTPTNSGNLTFSVIATDANGCTGTNHYTLVANCPPITVGPATLAEVSVGVAYSQTNTAFGGTLPYRFSVSGGNLPPGLAISNDGVVSGTPTNSGNYEFTIAATDAYGCLGSQDYSVMVEGAPVITGQPQSQAVTAGGVADLAVLANGLPEPAFQWYFNSANISGATSASLSISNFQSSNQGGYYVLASNEQGSVTSDIAQLYLADPLRFVNPSVNSNRAFHALIIGPVGTNFAVDGSTDMVNWNVLATNPAPLGILDFTDTNLSGQAPFSRFYRAWISP